eukprot:s1445_g3.t1
MAGGALTALCYTCCPFLSELLSPREVLALSVTVLLTIAALLFGLASGQNSQVELTRWSKEDWRESSCLVRQVGIAYTGDCNLHMDEGVAFDYGKWPPVKKSSAEAPEYDYAECPEALTCSLGVQFFWAWRVGPKGADPGNTRTLLAGNATRPMEPNGAAASEASGASVLVLMGPGSTFESSELLLNVALALQGLGFQVRALAPTDGPLQELRRVGLEAQVCQDLQKLALGEEQLRGEDSLQSLILRKCEVEAQIFMVFGDVWAWAIAKHRKDEAGKLLWFLFPLDRCKGLQPDALTQRAVALADHVIFLTAEERSAWQQTSSSKFHLFRPFVDVDRLHLVRGDLSGRFTVTLENACCDYGQIQGALGALSQRFGANWLLVVLATCEIDQFPSHQQFLLIKDKELFYQHMRGANLYVSLVPSGPSLSTAYASSLGIPSLATSNDQLLRIGRDGYLLPSQDMLPQFLAKINTSELRNVGLSARESGNLRFSMAAGQTRLGFLMDSLQRAEKTPRGTRIALFLQMHNASLWWSLSSCIENVLLAAAPSRSVDLFVITTSLASAATLRSLAGGLRKFGALRHVVVALGANKGADIGLFLQQLLLNVDLQLEVDLIFKLHSKRKELWRSLLVDSLCGSVEVVRRNVEAMERSPNIGIIGPSKLTWGPDSQSFIELKLKKKGFNEVALRGMNTTWAVLDTGSKFPDRKHWIICAGTFFWLRASFLSSWQRMILPAVPRILALSGNYSTGCDKANVTTCLLAVGLERASSPSTPELAILTAEPRQGINMPRYNLVACHNSFLPWAIVEVVPGQRSHTSVATGLRSCGFRLGYRFHEDSLDESQRFLSSLSVRGW